MKTWKTKKVDGVEGIALRVVDRETQEFPSSAYDSVTEHDKDDRVISVVLPDERFLPFLQPGKQLPPKAIYTIKAEKTDGSVIQIPLEDQINNNKASPENAIGLQGYIRKGYNVWFDFESGKASHCPSWDCWAKWNDKFEGYCSEIHQSVGNSSGDEVKGFGGGATTSGNSFR